MASPQAANVIRTELKVLPYWNDGDFSTAAAATGWIDMSKYSRVMAVSIGGNLTGAGVEALSIVADSDSDGGSGSNVTIATSADTAGTAEGDYIVVECSNEQIVQEGEDNSVDLRYISAFLTNDNAGDEAVTFLILYPKHPADGMTAGVST